MDTCFIPHTDIAASRVAYGVGMLCEDWRDSDLTFKSERAIRAAFDNGITFFDTADVYAEGRSEVAIGDAFKTTPELRERIVIQSKCGIKIRRGWRPSEQLDPGVLTEDLSRAHITSSVEGSLRRLNTDRLDILLLHTPSSLIEPEEVAAAFDQLHKSGKVRYFGTSAFNAVQIELLRKYVAQPLVANQVWLSLAHMTPMVESSGFGSLVDYCRLKEIQVQAYSPLKGGSIFAIPSLLNLTEPATEEAKELVTSLAELAKKYAVTPAAIMLAWLLRHPAGIIPIIGSTNPKHISENCLATRVDLERSDWHLLFDLSMRCG